MTLRTPLRLGQSRIATASPHLDPRMFRLVMSAMAQVMLHQMEKITLSEEQLDLHLDVIRAALAGAESEVSGGPVP